jgi:hypothetical protein
MAMTVSFIGSPQSLKNLLLVRMMLPISCLEQIRRKSSSARFAVKLHVANLVHNEDIRPRVDPQFAFKSVLRNRFLQSGDELR